MDPRLSDAPGRGCLYPAPRSPLLQCPSSLRSSLCPMRCDAGGSGLRCAVNPCPPTAGIAPALPIPTAPRDGTDGGLRSNPGWVRAGLVVFMLKTPLAKGKDADGSCFGEERFTELLGNEGWGTGGDAESGNYSRSLAGNPNPFRGLLSPYPTVVSPFCHGVVTTFCRQPKQGQGWGHRSSSSSGASNLAMALCGVL